MNSKGFKSPNKRGSKRYSINCGVNQLGQQTQDFITFHIHILKQCLTHLAPTCDDCHLSLHVDVKA